MFYGNDKLLNAMTCLICVYILPYMVIQGPCLVLQWKEDQYIYAIIWNAYNNKPGLMSDPGSLVPFKTGEVLICQNELAVGVDMRFELNPLHQRYLRICPNFFFCSR